MLETALVHVEGDRHGHIPRSSACYNVGLGKEPKGKNRSHEETVKKDGSQKGHRDLEYGLPIRRAVYDGGFVETLIDALKTGQHDNHVPRCDPPEDNENYRDFRPAGFNESREIRQPEDPKNPIQHSKMLLKDEGKGQRQGNDRDGLGYLEETAEEIPEQEIAAVENEGHEKTQTYNKKDVADPYDDRVVNGREEKWILNEHLVVRGSDDSHRSETFPPVKAHKQGVENRKNTEDSKQEIEGSYKCDSCNGFAELRSLEKCLDLH